MVRFSLLLFFLAQWAMAAPLEQPNILWISAEDMSPVLGCYGDKDAITPNIDKLSLKSVKFTHAFATAPVCSPSRSCLIQGVAAPSQGTHQMRSAFPIPKSWKGFPSLLRKAGYYTTNNVKTDYNTANFQDIIQASWDESSPKAHWRKGPKGKPFFSVFNLMTSHQSRSMVWPYEQFKKDVQSKLSPEMIHNPDKITLPSYYPDTPTIRREHARFYDCVTAMDREVGQILKQLKADGHLDNTIIFFFSDHGSGMPRHKRSLFDSGLKVPLLVHLPKKYQHLSPQKMGRDNNRLVSFIDYAPTVLTLAGLEVPSHMQGQNFMAKTFKREYVFGHRDRVDEVIDLARSVRSKKYLYIRNYMPFLSHFQDSSWPDLGDIRKDFKLARTQKGELSEAQWQFISGTRPIEELYDCEADPDNIHNLALNKDYQATLQEMKQALSTHALSTRDLGFLSESYQWERTQNNRAHLTDEEHRNIFDAAEAMGRATQSQHLEGLQSNHPAVRSWHALGLMAFPKLESDAISSLEKSLKDSDVSTRLYAAYALSHHQASTLGLACLERELNHAHLPTALMAARIVENLGKKAKSLKGAMTQLDERCKNLKSHSGPATVVVSGDEDTATFIRFSTQAFLKNI